MDDKAKITLWSILLLILLIFCSWYHSSKLASSKTKEIAQETNTTVTVPAQTAKEPITFDVIKKDKGIDIAGNFYDDAQMRSFGDNFQSEGDIHYLSNSFDKNREANEALTVARDLAPIFNKQFIDGSIRYRGKKVVVTGTIKDKDSFDLVAKILKEHNVEYLNNTKLLERDFEVLRINKVESGCLVDANLSKSSKDEIGNLNLKTDTIAVDDNLQNSKCFQTALKIYPIFNRDFQSGRLFCKDNKIEVDGVLLPDAKGAKADLEKILKDSSLEYYLNLKEPVKAQETKEVDNNSESSDKNGTTESSNSTQSDENASKTKESTGYNYENIYKNMSPEQQKVAKEIETSLSELLKMHNITFRTGSSRLTKAGKSAVQEVAKVLKRYPKVYIEIAGHTDDVGDDKANLTLSQRRVQRVKDELIDFGIEAKRLDAVGYGETRPLVPNDSAKHRKQNRRVEFHIIKIEE